MSEYYPKYLDMRTIRSRLVVDFIRNYDTFKEDADNLLLLNMALQTDGQPHGTGISDPVAETASQREKLVEYITAIEAGIHAVPEEYRAVVWEWVKNGTPLDRIPNAYAGESTYKRKKKIFIQTVAWRMAWGRVEWGMED